jgi:pimeloyl-ACP methyl ester carboxylesterase
MSKSALQNRIECLIDVLPRYPTKQLEIDAWKRRVLILESDNETGFNPKEREELRELYSQAVVHEFQGAGHMSLYTQPDEFVGVVRSFLTQYI